MLLSKTKFNKKAVAALDFKTFEKLYAGRFKGKVDLKKVFLDNDGKIDHKEEPIKAVK